MMRVRPRPATSILAVATSSLVLLIAAPLANAGAPTAASADAALQRQLRSFVAEPGGPPGALVVVDRGSRRAVFNVGVADRTTGRRIQIGDHWRIASVTKAFTSATALALVSR